MKKIIGIFVFLIIFSGVLFSEDQGRNVTVVNSGFYRKILQTPVIMRDKFFEKKINFIWQGRGTVKAVYQLERYRKKYMVELVDSDAGKFGIKLNYFIFTDNEDWKKVLTPGEVFDFKGQCIIITPLNTQRNSYVVDIVLEHGALLVQ